jgi:hypothetical protein
LARAVEAAALQPGSLALLLLLLSVLLLVACYYVLLQAHLQLQWV